MTTLMPTPAAPLPLDARLAKVTAEAVVLAGEEICSTVIIVVRGQESLDALGAFLTDKVAPFISEGHAEYDPICDKSYASWQEALKLRHAKLDKLEWFWAAGKKAIHHYVETQKEKQAAEERRQAALEWERLAKIREEEIEALEQSGASAGLIQAVCDEALPAPKIEVAPMYTMPAGFTSRDAPYKAEVFDIKLLCKAIVDGLAPCSYILPNQKALNKRAAADRELLSIPGVRSVGGSNTAARRL